MDWYYATNGQQNGPVSEQQLIELFQSGQVKATDLVWNESMTDWLPFRSAPGLSAAVPEAAPPAETAPTGQSTTSSPDYPEETASTETASATPASALTPVVNQSPLSATGEKVPTYLWQSIVCLILCCLPLSIPALIFATKVEPALQKGDLAAAKEASDKAKMWCWIAFGVGLVANILIFVLSFVGAIMEEM